MSSTLEAVVTVKKVLVVDDEATFREELARFLSNRELDVRSAADGLQAIERARAFEPDVILMDIGLGGSLDGIEAASVIQKMFPYCRLFFVSAYAERRDYRMRAEQAGLRVAGWIDKPVGGHQILELIEREDVMDPETEIDFLYGQIRDLVVLSAERPERRREIDPLIRRLRALQEAEAAKLERQLHQHRRLAPGTGWEILARTEKLLRK
jgi:CheY-like chemotaxis protein